LSLTLAQRDPALARRELVVVWAKCIAGLAVAKLVSLVEPTGYLAGNLAGVAAYLFIALPDRRLQARGERWESFGLPWWGLRDPRTWRAWGKGIALGVAVCALVFPPFFWGYRWFVGVLPHLPAPLPRLLAPYVGTGELRFRLPERFWLLVVNQFLVVALPEELFYRGWMQTTWRATRPGRNLRLLGATLGAGFLVTQVLFAAGHLVVFEFWRLGTFFPGLLFGWLRERKGDITVSVTVHALSNLYMAILESSFVLR
jgi:membrane protease YdiL (CAAX protease family)